jgi:DNA polymerase III alpha subunit
MNINSYGQVEITEEEAIDALYTGKIKSLDKVYIADSARSKFNQGRRTNGDRFFDLEQLVIPSFSVEEFDRWNQQQWFMPKDHCPDLIELLFNSCQTQEQIERVTTELELFVQYGMYDVLFYLKYLVDTMREQGIVWGVGRGSSVASYVLYLIGVHKVDSIKFSLDIKEFFK